jgi:HEPN domain-containing protein
MDEAKRDYILQWLHKAWSDIQGAKKLASPPNSLFEIAFYHCQKGAEKAVKGYLAFCDHPLEKTHNIGKLVKLAASYEPSFSAWLDSAESLTRYATTFRYPDDVPDPDEEDYRQAEKAAADIFAFVCSRLPEEARPTFEPPKP